MAPCLQLYFVEHACFCRHSAFLNRMAVMNEDPRTFISESFLQKVQTLKELKTVCHLILFLPVFALPVFLAFPFETALPSYLIILAVSLLVYFKIFEAMRQQVQTGREGIIGNKCLVIEDIDPAGKIRYASEIWNAKTNGSCFPKGEYVRICGMNKLMLLVEAFSTD